MASFKFKMDFLIKMRRRKEEEAMNRLARRLESIHNLNKDLTALTEQKQELAAEFSEKLHSGQMVVPLLTLYSDFKQKLGRDIARTEEFIYLSRREEAKERTALTKASVERKIIEKLKEKKKIEFIAEEAYIEQNNLEEMAALAKARRTREEKMCQT
ncbi:MAG: flagellar export protein FliJ [Candidatus Adiutrix sp.]